MKLIKPPFLFLLLVLWCTAFPSVYALSLDSSAYIKINNVSNDFAIPFSKLKILEDSSGKLEFDNVRKEEYLSLFQSYTEPPVFNSNRHYWVRFVLWNESDSEKNWILQLPLHSSQATIYIPNANEGVNKYNAGQHLPFETRDIDIRTIAFELPPQRKTPIEIFLRLHSEKHTDFSFVLSENRRYMEVHTKGYFFLGLIYGVLFLMSVYNFILYFSIREKIYLYYILYTLSSVFFLSWKDGLGFQFLWPEFPSVNRIHHSLGLFLLISTFLLYANNFLDLRRSHPKLFLVTYAIIAVNLIYFILNITDPTYFDPLPVMYILSYVYFFFVVILYIRRNYKPARYLLISLLCFIVALTVIKLRYLDIIGWNWFVEYILNYAVVVEVITMSLAIHDKIKYLRVQKEKALETKLTEEKLKAENELIQLRNSHLQAEVNHQNTELALLATNLAQRAEFLSQFKKEIQLLQKELPNNSSIQKLSKTLESGAELDTDWDQFQLNFDKLHNNYLARLREQFPGLKPSDLLLCAYIKLNKSNKEIASLLNITVSGVEKKRVRLKEKLKLENEISLSEYLINLK